MKPDISIVIPLLNKGPHVQRALQSVMDQTIQDFEIIVVDGGSTDYGPDVVKEFNDPRIRFIQQKGTGVSTARNQGVGISQSDFIAFLDADDEWMPHHLETIQKLRKEFPQAGAYTTAYKIQEANGELRWAKYEAIPTAPWKGLIPNYFKSGTLGEYPVWTSVVGIPKKIFIEMGGFPEDSWYGEDADLFGKIALKYPIAFSWYIGAIYHWGAVNRTCNRQIPLEPEPFVKTALQSIENGTVPGDLLYDVKEYIARKEIDRAARNLFVGRTVEAIQILKTHKTNYHWHKRLILLVMAAMPYSLFQKVLKLKRTFNHCVKVAMSQ
jgi:glycosyltransferase involved in cell wall biosynthesis